MTATVPRTTRSAPRASALAMVARSRSPPPTSIRAPVAAMALRARAFLGAPAEAPSRSTTWSHLAPASRNARAWAAGSSA